MPIQHSLWVAGQPPTELRETRLVSEFALHQMIRAAPQLLSPDWMLIGSEQSAVGGRFDLLAISPDAGLVLNELKRDRTPREVVAQALDYASWVQGLTPEDVAAIYKQFCGGRDLAADFEHRFGSALDDDEINNRHEIVVVASELDASTERIVRYLGERGIAINVLFFRVFQYGETQLISRAWLTDPIEAQTSTTTSGGRGPRGPWNGEYYVSFGAEPSRSWEEARRYGFICGGGGLWYSRTLNQLSIGGRVWINIPGTGYVGLGVVTGPAQPFREFQVQHDGQELPAAAVLKLGDYHRDDADDLEKCEWFVPIRVAGHR